MRMEPHELNIKVARLTYPEVTDSSGHLIFCGGNWWKPRDYCGDLNAIRVVELLLSTVPQKTCADERCSCQKSDATRYRENLCVITMMEGGPITASSMHRTLAYIKTKEQKCQPKQSTECAGQSS